MKGEIASNIKRGSIESALVVINEEYVDEQTLLKEGDVVAIILIC
ncbi:hypothetical protein GT022_16485 [Agaribacter marinus]|uniref:MoaD/ThiS family protein n=1 Tax=Virgibacillus salarius TaxID=447199 RepID=A0A941E2E0_9BACI|nr:MoaD/ThiS family protein [Virgibacillus salarius]NAZ10343.1 hypothetical protein [Agaribacter marinus]QRZ20175.1 MoaD/ThiS family protein [Virgibacillus sp. AGTR]